VTGTAMLADAAVPQTIGPQMGSTPLSQVLFGNDVITPAHTFYEIAILDQNRNVIQAGIYQFANAVGDVDLSSVSQILPPYGFYLGNLVSAQCDGDIPGETYVSPGPIVALFYNGILLPRGAAAPRLSYTASGNTAILNFSTQPLDRIDSLCVL
jgi:hypothetical protein